MQRYLLQIGYCGRSLRGIQKQTEEVEARRSSVQGLLEKGLATLDQLNTPILHFSSRTDKGVHAVCNTAHVDLTCRSDGLMFEPNKVTLHLNRFLNYANADIRIHKTTLVPSTFHARYDAVARSYLYRLAVTPQTLGGSPMHLEEFMPSTELGRLYLVRPPFDVESVKPVCRLLEGVHDFASFANCSARSNPPKSTVREIHSLSVAPGRPLLHPSYDSLYSQLQFWDINIQASGFLYKQVRRTVGALVGIAQGRVSLQEIQHMLDKPSHENWVSRCQVASPYGLYLLNVEYPADAFCEKEETKGEKETKSGEDVEVRKASEEDYSER